MIRILLVVLVLWLGQSSQLFAELPTPEPAGALFKDRPFGPQPPPTPTPASRRINPDDDKPIPLSWIIGGASAAALAIAALLYGSARQWRSSNLFDRQYRFPADPKPALRFGAKKCGGHLARVQFGSALGPSPQRSETKDA